MVPQISGSSPFPGVTGTTEGNEIGGSVVSRLVVDVMDLERRAGATLGASVGEGVEHGGALPLACPSARASGRPFAALAVAPGAREPPTGETRF
jgi:hypothetical protein